MADFVANTHSTIIGTTGEDRLTVTWSLGALSFLGSLTPNPISGYDGHFSTGYAGEGVYFSGIEHFTFEDLAGASNRIYTGSGDDVLLGGGGDDTLDVGSGDDHADGGAGTDMFGANLSGWTDAAVIDLNGVSTLISGTVSNMEGFYDLVTGAGDDVIAGHSSSYMSDTIATGSGDDLIQLWTSTDKDVVDGGEGQDRLSIVADWHLSFIYSPTPNPVGGYDGHFSTGYAGEGVYFSGIEHFSFEDRAGTNNVILTGSGDDVLLGGGGDDRLLVGSGDDHADGGAGTDMFGADLSGWTDTAVINLNRVSTLINGTVSNMEGFEAMVTGAGDDTVIGHRFSFVSDEIDTGAGNDRIRLWWNGEADTVVAGEGSDRLTVVASDFMYLGGLTEDTGGGYSGSFSTGYAGEGVYFSGIEHFTFTDRAAADNTITTGAGIDVIRAGGGDDVLDGGGGNDPLNGGPGRDHLMGGVGNDRLDGGAMNDILDGGAGRDELTGGQGNDRLTGGEHADQFIFNAGDGSDVIVDFGIGADLIVIGDGAEGFSDVTVADAGVDTIVQFDDVTIRLIAVDHLTVDADDFLFV